MPRCLMAKKWKAYPWPDRGDFDPPGKHPDDDEDDEEIDVVGDTSPIKTSVIRRVGSTSAGTSGSATSAATTTSVIQEGPGSQASSPQQQACWSPASPTAGATAPSPPPQSATAVTLDTRVSVLYHGYVQELTALPFTAYLPQHPSLSPGSPAPTYATLQPPSPSSSTPRRCFTSTGAQLSLPPKKKDIYRPYSLEPSRSSSPQPLDVRPEDEPRQYVEVARPEPQRARPITLTIARPIPIEASSGYPPMQMDRLDRLDGRAPLSISTAGADDLTAAHAILDLSASTLPYPRPVTPQPLHQLHHEQQQQQQQIHEQHQLEQQQQQHHEHMQQQQHHEQLLQQQEMEMQQHQQQLHADPQQQQQHDQQRAALIAPAKPASTKTVSYTYEAFFVSDGRSKRKSSSSEDEAAAAPTEKKGRYACGECGKRYATSSNLSRHKQTHRSLDSGSARQCNVCGKAYVSMPALAMHVLTHQLTHACGVCGKLFSRPWLLQGHLRSHTGEKPYGCAHCGKAFADRSNLRAHMQTHSQDKSYSCHRCHKSFALKSYLNKHLESSCVRDGASSSEESSASAEDSSSSSSAFAAPNNMVSVSFPTACSA